MGSKQDPKVTEVSLDFTRLRQSRPRRPRVRVAASDLPPSLVTRDGLETDSGVRAYARGWGRKPRSGDVSKSDWSQRFRCRTAPLGSFTRRLPVPPPDAGPLRHAYAPFCPRWGRGCKFGGILTPEPLTGVTGAPTVSHASSVSSLETYSTGVATRRVTKGGPVSCGPSPGYPSTQSRPPRGVGEFGGRGMKRDFSSYLGGFSMVLLGCRGRTVERGGPWGFGLLG